jgi:hypothetical protein
MNTNVFTLDVYCVDIIQKDRANINTILSDTQLILNDLYLYYTDGTDLSVTVITDPTMTPLNNFDLDYVAGWVGTFTFEVDQYSVCAIPLEPITPVTNECPPAQYLVEYENGTDIKEGTIPSGGSLTIQVPNPSECEPAIAEIYFEDELIDILTIASGDTDIINIDCSTLMNAVKVTSTWQQHKHGGTFKHIGEFNGKPAYQSTTDTTKTIKYSGVNWQIIKTAPQAHVHNAANGNEAYPWLATWLDNYLTVSQATVGVYCTNGGMAYYNLVDSEGNILSQGSISEGDEDDILAPDTDLEINGSAVDSFNAASTINVTLENGSGIVTPDNITVIGNTVEVVLPSGRLSTSYTYVAAPVISAISSTTGSANGGASVVISGTNFTGTTRVIFGGIEARSFVVNSDTQIIALTPTRAAGVAVVQVITPGGTANSAISYTFVAAPTVTSLSPNTGTTSGGTAVTINGTNLVGVTTVLFGTVAATSFNVISATQIVAIAPAVTTGVVNVTVTNAGGSAAGAYTYSAAAPSITALSPVSGTTAGGTSVVITGTNFIGTTAVTFGGVNATSFVVNSATQITALTPPRAPGSATIAVVTPGGTITTNFTFSSLPTATTLSPTSGTTSGGVTVTINGTNFTGATGVTFGGTNATSFTVVSATQITAVSPARTAGAITVDVITPGGIARASDAFTFVAATPTVTAFTPNSGSTGGGTSILITGTNFIGTTGVSIGGVTATSFIVNSATQISAVAAAGTGSGAVTVTTPGGTGTSATAYSYLAPPVITSLNVTTGSTTGGTTVVISGTGFTGTTSVTFGGTAAAIVSTTDTAITVTTPAKPAGAVTVVVTTSVSSASSATGAYTYTDTP